MDQQRSLELGFFRDGEDGTTVFFPWGLAHRGYCLPDAAARKKAARSISLLMSSVVGIGVWTAHALPPILGQDAPADPDFLAKLVAPGIALIAAVASYWLWASRFVEGFPESDLRVSREQRLRDAAALAEPRKIAWAGAALAAMSGLVIWIEPGAWWLGGLGIALGVGTLVWSRVLKRVAAGAPE